jgi:queuine tRNA-ribosyltransferase
MFRIEKEIPNFLGRAGVLETSHGPIRTPAFVTVGTKCTVKSLTPEQVGAVGAQVVLANTYHLYLEPGEKMVKAIGGLGRMMHWQGPTMTDSGGFQAFSLGVAYEYGIGKFVSSEAPPVEIVEAAYDSARQNKKAKITEDGVEFQSVIDGSTHFFSPEKSIQIQHDIGADIIFAFDECTSPHGGYEYLKESMERTHRWAERSLEEHRRYDQSPQQLFGIVQGGRYRELREESARVISTMDFDGFGIGGSFVKEDMDQAVSWVNAILPKEKPRHLLGVGEPLDLFGAVENGCDLFDCVAPTRVARNGTLYTKNGKVNILNNKFRSDLGPIDEGCGCYTCQNYTRSYVAHLFRAKEILASTLASIHNLYFIINTVAKMREAILGGTFFEYKKAFVDLYSKG